MFWCNTKENHVELEDCKNCTSYYECETGYARYETFEEHMKRQNEDDYYDDEKYVYDEDEDEDDEYDENDY